MKVYRKRFTKAELTEPEIVKMVKGLEVGDWVYCLHCERAYQVGDFAFEIEILGARNPEVIILQMCPYEDCDGDAVIDARPWGVVADDCGYPALPERGKVYPLCKGGKGEE